MKNASLKVSNTYSKKGPLNDGHYVVILLLFCTFMNHPDDFGSCCENMAGFIRPLSKTFNFKSLEYRYYWSQNIFWTQNLLKGFSEWQTEMFKFSFESSKREFSIFFVQFFIFQILKSFALFWSRFLYCNLIFEKLISDSDHQNVYSSR